MGDKKRMYVYNMGTWHPMSLIMWNKEGTAYPDTDDNDPEPGEVVSKLVMISIENRGKRKVIMDARYNYYEKCWEILMDATGGYYEELHRDTHVEYWAYYPEPVIPTKTEETK